MSDQKIEGYLFLCTNRTQRECFQKKLFGRSHKFWGWVEQIRAGSSLFLYNIDSKTLFGIFRAASEGKLNIDPAAWKNMRPLSFPAQVIVEWDRLHKINNAHKTFKFLKDGNLCKLTLAQTNALKKALEEAPIYEPLIFRS